jgi:protocatechuate 3,4-dioxygenase beta subunit
MRFLLLMLTTVVVAQGPQNVLPLPDPADNATVEGSIVTANQTRPLEGIPVYLSRENENATEAQRRGVSVTDGAGQFRLKDVPPGDYIVVADRTGYFRAEDNPTRIRVAPKAAIRGVALRMIIGGSISGRIVDINNQGLAGARVTAQQPGYLTSGQRQLQDRSASFFTTDDRGDYRIRGLRPGTYYVRASMDFWASDAAAYYPGTRDELAAAPIVVREAQDSIASFPLEVKLMPVFTISGVVTSGIAGVLNKPIPRIFVAQGDDGGTYYDNRADDRSNGRFEIRNIFAGAYELYPEARDADGRLYTSRTSIDVVNKNIENLALPAAPIVDVRGRVLLNGEAPGGRLQGQNNALNIETVRGLSRFLIYMGVNPGNPILGPAAANPPSDRETGEFTIAGMPPGVYKLSVLGMPPDAYLEDLRQGNVSVYDEGFTVTDRPGDPIQALLATPGARVEGIVRDAKREPAPTVLVVLIPEASRRHDRVRFKNIASDKDGKFALRGIPPGNYKIFAIDNFPQNAWRNAEFMQKYESKGQSLTLAKGASTTVELTRIPWEATP